METRKIFIEAALKVFAQKGYDGARIQDIINNSNLTGPTLYKHFGKNGKEELFKAVFSEAFPQRHRELIESFQHSPKNLPELLPYWLTIFSQVAEWTRLLQWEALNFSDGKGLIYDGEERKQFYRIIIAMVGKMCDDGDIPKDLDPKYLVLAVIALSTLPVVYSNLVYMMTGLDYNKDEDKQEIHREMTKFLTTLGSYLLPRNSTRHESKKMSEEAQ